jgi:hypothetical protein
VCVPLKQCDNNGIGDDNFLEMTMEKNDMYQPYVEDVNKRIKLLVTPVRSDGLQGPTYQHIMSPLTLPLSMQVICDCIHDCAIAR